MAVNSSIIINGKDLRVFVARDSKPPFPSLGTPLVKPPRHGHGGSHPSLCSGYFGVKRFDRIKDKEQIKRVHMVSVAALLETDYRIPNLDYNDLMLLTLKLTKDYSEVEKLFRLMSFNVFAHNRDDHSKNFSFIYDIDKKQWRLSPAYDLTYNNSIGGEHATSVDGNGKDPDTKDLLVVAQKIEMDMKRAKKILEDIKDTCNLHNLTVSNDL